MTIGEPKEPNPFEQEPTKQEETQEQPQQEEQINTPAEQFPEETKEA